MNGENLLDELLRLREEGVDLKSLNVSASYHYYDSVWVEEKKDVDELVVTEKEILLL